jgi:hypothetical protein
MKSNSEKTNYWRKHIKALKVSGLSRTANCEANQTEMFLGGAESFLDEEEHFFDPPEYILSR